MVLKKVGIRTDQLRSCLGLPKLWIVEKTFGSINRGCRLATDFKTLVCLSDKLY
jgi:hypothetical protein